MPIPSDLVQRLQTRGGTHRRRWLVTGAAGFIGSNLLEALLASGQTVVGLDNFATGSPDNLREVQRDVGPKCWDRFTFIEGDIRNLETCQRACTGIDVVLHEAALGSVPRSFADPIATNQTNIDGFLNMMVAARDRQVGRFVYAASSSTYGDSKVLPKVEDRIGKPLSPYAVTKLVNELYAGVFSAEYGLETIGLRYFNVFGRRQTPHGAYAAVIPRWIGSMLAGDSCLINGDGETTRDFCYIGNVIQANVLAALTASPDALNQIYNIAYGGRTTLNTLHESIRARVAQVLGRVSASELPDPQFVPFRDGDVRDSQADISKARRLLGYAPTHDLDAGLDEAMPWYARYFAERVAEEAAAR